MYLLRSSRANATGSFPAWPPSPYRPSGRTARPGSFPRVRGCEGESDGEGRQRKGGQRKAEIAELRAELLLMVEVMLEQFPPKREASSAGVFLFLAGRGPRSIRMGKNTATTSIQPVTHLQDVLFVDVLEGAHVDHRGPLLQPRSGEFVSLGWHALLEMSEVRPTNCLVMVRVTDILHCCVTVCHCK